MVLVFPRGFCPLLFIKPKKKKKPTKTNWKFTEIFWIEKLFSCRNSISNSLYRSYSRFWFFHSVCFCFFLFYSIGICMFPTQTVSVGKIWKSDRIVDWENRIWSGDRCWRGELIVKSCMEFRFFFLIFFFFLHCDLVAEFFIFWGILRDWVSEKSYGFDQIGSWKVRPCLVCFVLFFLNWSWFWKFWNVENLELGCFVLYWFFFFGNWETSGIGFWGLGCVEFKCGF